MKRKGATRDLEVQENNTYEFIAMNMFKRSQDGCKFITANEYISAERSRGAWGASIKKRETNEIADQCIYYKPYEGKYPVDVTFIWHTATRKDSDNLAFAEKFIFDGMVQGGIITNDSPKYVADLTHKFRRSKEHRNEIVIVKLKEHSDESGD